MSHTPPPTTVGFNAIFYRGTRLERVPSKPDAEDRFEAPPFGPHFPLPIWIERRTAKHQWCAAFLPGCVAYSWDPEDALDEARQRAIEYLYSQARSPGEIWTMSNELTIKELVASPPTDMLAWAVMTLISHFPTKNFLEHFGIDASNHDNTVKVELKINGIEVSPREVFRQLDEQHSEMVKAQALQLIKEKLAGLDDITTLISDLRSFAERKASSALGVEWRDSW